MHSRKKYVTHPLFRYNEFQMKNSKMYYGMNIQKFCKHFRHGADRFTLRFQLTANEKVHKN